MKTKKYKFSKQKILGIDTNAKTIKGQKYNYITAIIYMASHKQSGFNVCSSASVECSKNCLFFSGYGAFKFTQESRIKKTKRYFEERNNFMNQLKHEIKLFINKAKRLNLTPCIRLNGTSDLPYENYKFNDGLNIFESFPDLIFYDYTTINKRMYKYLNGELPKNYHLTFSRKEDNQLQVIETLKNGGNVSVVFEKYLPKVYKGFKVLNGDKNDLRFLDDKNSVIGLIYKRSKGDITKIGKNSFIIKQ
jgi:hypothetical protein